MNQFCSIEKLERTHRCDERTTTKSRGAHSLAVDSNNLLIIFLIDDDSTSLHQAFQGIFVLVILTIGKEGFHIDSFADNILDLVTPTGSFDISRKGPLADTPMLDATFAPSLSIMTRHVPTAPIGLTRHLTKVAATAGIICTAQIYTNVMGTTVALATFTIPGSGIPCQGHVLRRTCLQGSSKNIQMRRQTVVWLLVGGGDKDHSRKGKQE
jgi:hypothetical protein